MAIMFRYFERPHDFSTYQAEPRSCNLCGQVRFGYAGPFYGLDRDIEFVCEECLASGRLAERGITTNEGDIAALRKQLTERHPDFDAEERAALAAARTAELHSRTPHLVTWQDFFWPAHCGDYCAFVKEVGAPDVRRLAGDQDPVAFLAAHLRNPMHEGEAREVWESIRPDAPQNSQTAYSVGVYHFRCLRCGEPVLIWDCD